MPFQQSGAVRFFQFETLNAPEMSHAIFTRRGGVSPEPWCSLNVGATVGDDLQRVKTNRERILTTMGRRPDSVYDAWQVHSADVIRARAPRGEAPPLKADALISDTPGVTLVMRFADCVPILLFDPVRPAVGMVHAGWLGTVRRTASAAVRAMVRELGSRPQDLRAGIGPSIGPDHYPIGPDVIQQVRDAFGAEADAHLVSHGGELRLDLWSANRALLQAEGVHQIEIAGVCTACHVEDWFSHRAENGRTGRFGALIALGEA